MGTVKMNSQNIGLVLYGLFVAVSACSNGWVQHNTNCYHFSHDKESWLGAREMCNQIIGGELIEINDADENKFVAGEIALRNNYTPFIALTDVVEENVWVWMSSNTHLTNTSYTNWDHGQPNNNGGSENCVKMTTGGFWNDVSCSDDRFFICEQDVEAGSIVVG